MIKAHFGKTKSSLLLRCRILDTGNKMWCNDEGIRAGFDKKKKAGVTRPFSKNSTEGLFCDGDLDRAYSLFGSNFYKVYSGLEVSNIDLGHLGFNIGLVVNRLSDIVQYLNL